MAAHTWRGAGCELPATRGTGQAPALSHRPSSSVSVPLSASLPPLHPLSAWSSGPLQEAWLRVAPPQPPSPGLSQGVSGEAHRPCHLSGLPFAVLPGDLTHTFSFLHEDVQFHLLVHLSTCPPPQPGPRQGPLSWPVPAPPSASHTRLSRGSGTSGGGPVPPRQAQTVQCPRVRKTCFRPALWPFL